MIFPISTIFFNASLSRPSIERYALVDIPSVSDAPLFILMFMLFIAEIASSILEITLESSYIEFVVIANILDNNDDI